MIKTAAQIAFAKFAPVATMVEEVNHNTLLSSKEVAMSKVHAVIVKQSPVVNPKVEEVPVKKQEPMFTLAQVKQIVSQEVSKALSRKQEVKKQQEVKKPQPQVVRSGQVIKVKATTMAQPVEEVKPKADMHLAGQKAYATRISKVLIAGGINKMLRQGMEVGTIMRVTVDSGLPTEKEVKVRFDGMKGQEARFRAKVEKKSGEVSFLSFSL